MKRKGLEMGCSSAVFHSGKSFYCYFYHDSNLHYMYPNLIYANRLQCGI